MVSSTQNSATDIVKNQAVLWFTRMQSNDVSEEQRQEFRAWMETPMHRDAFNKIEREYQNLDNIDNWAVDELQRLEQSFKPENNEHNRWLSSFGVKAMAASFITALIATLAFVALNQPRDIQYQTVKGEQRKIVLPDGSRVHLNSSSSIDVNFSDQIREVNLQYGEGLFDVAHQPNRPFVVRVGDNKIVAVGTSFSVYANQNQVDVTVVEGRIAIVPAGNKLDDIDLKRVASDGKSGVLLDKNRSAHVNQNGEVEEVQVVDAERLTAWNRGLIVLDRTPLRQVAKELSRYVSGSISVAEEVPDYPVTGVIKIRDQDAMLGLLSEVVPVISVRQSSQLTMLYPLVETKENK